MLRLPKKAGIPLYKGGIPYRAQLQQRGKKEMLYKMAETKVKPKVYSVIAIDPAAHGGLSAYTLANDYRILQGLSAHRDLNQLYEQLSLYEHPIQRVKGDEKSGTGVFLITRNGNFIFATLRGNTHTVLHQLYQLISVNTDIPIIMIERPHPNNVALNQTAGIFAGLAFCFNTFPVVLPPRDWGHNAKRLFNIYLRRFGVRYDNPSPHEIDAFLHFYSVFYPERTRIENDETDEAEDASKEVGEIREIVISDEGYLPPATLPSVISINNKRYEDLERFAEYLVTAAEHKVNGKDILREYKGLIKKLKNATKFTIW